MTLPLSESGRSRFSFPSQLGAAKARSGLGRYFRRLGGGIEQGRVLRALVLFSPIGRARGPGGQLGLGLGHAGRNASVFECVALQLPCGGKLNIGPLACLVRFR